MDIIKQTKELKEKFNRTKDCHTKHYLMGVINTFVKCYQSELDFLELLFIMVTIKGREGDFFNKHIEFKYKDLVQRIKELKEALAYLDKGEKK